MTSLIERVNADNSMVVRPTQSLTTSESSRVSAEIQSRMMIANARPRDEIRSLDKIKVSCQRLRLAESAEYVYAKGGQDIIGPTIRLLECCARHWGNIDYGFREIASGSGESTIEACALDLESNTREYRLFVVPHRIKAGNGFKTLIDPREIYEHIANQAQRRVRSCLEHVIPRDVWEEAVDECRNTLKAEVKIDADAIKKLVDAFVGLGVTREQVEQRIQRKIDAIAPAQFLSLRRIYNSIKDGMSVAADWFKPVESDDKPAKKSTKQKLKEATETPESNPVETSPSNPDIEDIESQYDAAIREADSVDAVVVVLEELNADERLPIAIRKTLSKYGSERVEALKS